MFAAKFESLAHLSVSSSTAEKTYCGENAQRSHQQLHRAAQGHSREEVPQAGAQLQAGESRHPGDDRELPEAAAAADPLSQRLQPRPLSLLEGLRALPLCRIQHRGLCHSSAAAGAAAPSGPESWKLLPTPLHRQAHHAAGQQQQRLRVEALVETDAQTLRPEGAELSLTL